MKRLAFISLGLLLIVTLALAGKLFHVTQANFSEYKQLLAQAEEANSPQINNQLERQQSRKNVLKEIYQTKDHKRVCTELSCRDSAIIISYSGPSCEMYEIMNDVHGQVEGQQDEGCYSFFSEKGLFYFHRQEFEAYNAKLVKHPHGSDLGVSGEAAWIAYHPSQNGKIEAKRFHAHLPFFNISAEKMQVVDNTVELDGDVQLHHEEGRASSEKAFISFEGTSMNELSAVLLSEHVILHKEDCSIICDTADFDCKKGTASFHGLPHSDVMLDGCFNDKENNNVPFLLTSQEMRLSTKQENKKIDIMDVWALGDVKGHYADYFLKSDQAHYSPQDGKLTTVSHHAKPCILSKAVDGSDELNTIEADSMTFITADKQIKTVSPKGCFTRQNEQNVTQKLVFEANYANWNELESHLDLIGDVKIFDDEYGHIFVEDRVILKWAVGSGERKLKTIHTKGKTTLVHFDEKGIKHKITSQDGSKVDLVKQIARMGMGKERNLVSVEDPLGTIHATHLDVFYEYANGHFEPHQIKLIGNVKMHNDFALDGLQAESPLDQYVIADSAIYYPNTKIIKLIAQPKKRVLFFDRINNLKISAPEITLQRDKVTRRESVKGTGDVRFTFIEREQEEVMRFMKQLRGTNE